MTHMVEDVPVQVDKFGGTSLATAERIRVATAQVVSKPGESRRVVVVSALGGVTDRLIGAIDAALERSEAYKEIIEELKRRHEDVLAELVPSHEEEAVRSQLSARWRELNELLDGVFLLRECTKRTQDAIMATGERLSALLVAGAFRSEGHRAVPLDATQFIRTNDSFGEASVDFEETYALVREQFEGISSEKIAVVTGFIAATERGVVTTLGRSGSDYTATLLAGALNAERVTIWTDVDGVLSADPRLVGEAHTLSQMNYQEAAEMAYFGAQVMHPRTIRPLRKRSIPLLIKNTLNPKAAGTLISREGSQEEGHVKAVTTIRRVAIVTLEGDNLIGVRGVSARALVALAEEGINILMISQASSEQSMCFVVRESDAEASVRALQVAFDGEIRQGDVSRITAQKECAVIAAVGDHMRQRPGLAGRMFATLGRSGVNVQAIAQGAAETNISAVVYDEEVPQAVRALHETFVLSRNRAHVFVIGTGVVGTTLLEILEDRTPALLERLSLNLQLVGLANTQQMVWDVRGIPIGEALDRLEKTERPTDLDAIIRHLIESRLERLIVVDATASDEVAHRYPELLEHSTAVITPNKRANTQDWSFYQRLQRAARDNQVPFLYETTVGAGLPVITTLRDLLRTGDQIRRIEGVFSGTLGYIFNSLAAGTSFSEAVRTARESGYTEPDPRDDLKGEDVARKLMILAREMDLSVERTDVTVESLVPPDLAGVPLESFMEQLEEHDAAWEERMAEAGAENRLHYIGKIEGDQLSVRVREVEPDSPFARLRRTDNMIVFTTDRYHDNPLIVQGPGAGPSVTAAGILADLIKAAERVS